MKFKLIESKLNIKESLEDNFNDELCKELANKYTQDTVPKGPTYLLKDGKFINIDEFFKEYSYDIKDPRFELPYHYAIQDYITEQSYVYGGEDFFMEMENAVRLNDGSVGMDESYMELPENNLTNEQYYSLINWLDYVYKN